MYALKVSGATMLLGCSFRVAKSSSLYKTIGSPVTDLPLSLPPPLHLSTPLHGPT